MNEKHEKELLSLEVKCNSTFECVSLFSYILCVYHITLNWETDDARKI